MKSDHTEGGLPSNLELTAENRLLFERTLVKPQGILVEKVLKLGPISQKHQLMYCQGSIKQ